MNPGATTVVNRSDSSTSRATATDGGSQRHSAPTAHNVAMNHAYAMASRPMPSAATPAAKKAAPSATTARATGSGGRVPGQHEAAENADAHRRVDHQVQTVQPRVAGADAGQPSVQRVAAPCAGQQHGGGVEVACGHDAGQDDRHHPHVRTSRRPATRLRADALRVGRHGQSDEGAGGPT